MFEKFLCGSSFALAKINVLHLLETKKTTHIVGIFFYMVFFSQYFGKNTLYVLREFSHFIHVVQGKTVLIELTPLLYTIICYRGMGK